MSNVNENAKLENARAVFLKYMELKKKQATQTEQEYVVDKSIFAGK